ncbi:hypothetical protein PFICI_03283 [Pestalotiopsis fici W106-1]|uniref:SNF2 N-terminal domain-containing protein n=1 Tax=Pestalotiopsis fici (strain W106-1 / CGMCC3.15140) TaxID=1229662 RepID=W3XGR0_PESFW|nr:uncharacterized protein PFICI_03283 [Pestalotiopsis fici W106-1]ETS85258.1 hypothetical protein PFICI_03283 [Pestalotiopsis fici W106-1]
MAGPRNGKFEFSQTHFDQLQSSINRLYPGPDLGSICLALRTDAKTSVTLLSSLRTPGTSGQYPADYQWDVVGGWLYRGLNGVPMPDRYCFYGRYGSDAIDHFWETTNPDDPDGQDKLHLLLARISKGSIELPTQKENGLLCLEFRFEDLPISFEQYKPWDELNPAKSHEVKSGPAGGSSKGRGGSSNGGEGSSNGGGGSSNGGEGSSNGGEGSSKGGQGSSKGGQGSSKGGQGSSKGGQGSSSSNVIDLTISRESSEAPVSPKTPTPKTPTPKTPTPKTDKGKGKAPLLYPNGLAGGSGSGGNADDADPAQDDGHDEDDQPGESNEQRDQAVIEAIGVHPKLDDDAFWQRVCEFFVKDTTDLDSPANRRFKIPGLLKPLYDYQAAMVLWVLSRYPEHRLTAAGMADEMGLGKTFMCIATMVVFNHICTAKADVERSLNTHEHRKHLRPRHAGGRTCPSQDEVTKKYGIQCPCVQGSWSQRIADTMHDLPSVIIAPPRLLTLWAAEWDKFVEPGTSMQLHVYSSTFKYLDKYASDEVLVRRASASNNVMTDRPHMVTQGRTRLYYTQRQGFEGGSSQVVLISHNRAGGVIGHFEEEVGRNFPENITAKENKLACSFVFFDEMHEYRGSTITKRTAPFKLLHEVAYNNSGPTVAVCVSGSLMTLGPTAWAPLINYSFLPTNRLPTHVGFASMKRANFVKEFAELSSAWKYAGQKVDKADAATDVKFRTSIQYLQETCEIMFPRMIIRRTKTDKFRGREILELPVLTPICERLDLPEGTTSDSISRLCKNVRAFLMNKKKSTDDLVGSEIPILTNQAAALKGPVKKWSGNHYYNLMQVTSYPFLARMGGATGLDIRAENIDKQAIDYTRLLNVPGTTRQELLNALRRSPLWEYRGHLAARSPKYMYLERLVQDLVHLRHASPSNQPDEGPADKSYVRHMVVFTETPVSAFITTMLLMDRVEDIEVLLFHSGLPPAAMTKSRPEHSRQAFLDYFDRNCRKGEKIKIIVGPYSLLSTGINLQSRTSRAVLMDVGTATHRSQAIARVYRLGQKMPVEIYELWSSKNLFEVHRMRAIERFDEIMDSSNIWGGNVYRPEVNWEHFGVPPLPEGDDMGEDEEIEYSPEPSLSGLSDV